MCKKKNSNKLFLAGRSELVLRDLQTDQNERISLEFDSLANIASDPHMDRFAFSHQNSIVLLDRRTSSEKPSSLISKAHLETVTSLEFNPSKHNTILSSSFDHCLKVWDLRRSELPVMIYNTNCNPIESARYNPVYDQLLLFSSSFLTYQATDGSISLFQANSVSSTPALDDSAGDQIIATHEGCLEDVVNECLWSASDPWVMAGVSHTASVYCDIVPEKEKLKILL